VAAQRRRIPRHMPGAGSAPHRDARTCGRRRDDRPVEGDAPAGEEDGLAEDQGGDREVHRVADEEVEATDHQGAGGRDRGRGAKPLPSEAGEGFKDDGEAGGDPDEACPAEGTGAVARRQRAPVGDQPGHQAGDRAGGEDQEGETAKRRLDPTRHVPLRWSRDSVLLVGARATLIPHETTRHGVREGWILTAGRDGWRGRIRTFDLLIQSLCIGIRLASRVLSVRRASLGRRIGVSQVPTPK
jgi:hypothetical protein